MSEFSYNFKQAEDDIEGIIADEKRLEELKEDIFHSKNQFIARLGEAMDSDASPERQREIENSMEEYFELYSEIEDSLESEAEAIAAEKQRLNEKLEEKREEYRREQNEEMEGGW